VGCLGRTSGEALTSMAGWGFIDKHGNDLVPALWRGPACGKGLSWNMGLSSCGSHILLVWSPHSSSLGILDWNATVRIFRNSSPFLKLWQDLTGYWRMLFLACLSESLFSPVKVNSGPVTQVAPSFVLLLTYLLTCLS
jgi:hypothetical protein